ncbi:magnesium/cobalt transporter CorA [Paraflavisolibacter sp. H34]|uniref:magnesium/cobalt transporter CorA n=1 Tax=Huijunlia imazamoxiresistens TaxID=3127457 RepID=UPI0030176EF7
MRPEKYLRYFVPSSLFGTQRTKDIVHSNPITPLRRTDAEKVVVTVFEYDAQSLKEYEFHDVESCFRFKDNPRITWINIDGLRKADVEAVSRHFGIHPLLAEDILSMHQRPKMDEVERVLYCLLNMLYYNSKDECVELEQISIVLATNTVITFQDDPKKDVFNPIRDKLRLYHSKVRQRPADYLCYSMLDGIVDHYFLVMEKLGERIEQVEEEVIRSSNKRTLAHINQLRKELIILKRNIVPVRDLVNSLIRSESDLLEESTTKYFKDVYDHIIQAYDLSENYRDMMTGMQDLYINNVNLRMNEVMKVMAIVTCLLAPATVIGGIFGMNFDIIPLLHNKWGFFLSVGAMLLIPLWMLKVFKRKGWF